MGMFKKLTYPHKESTPITPQHSQQVLRCVLGDVLTRVPASWMCTDIAKGILIEAGIVSGKDTASATLVNNYYKRHQPLIRVRVMGEIVRLLQIALDDIPEKLNSKDDVHTFHLLYKIQMPEHVRHRISGLNIKNTDELRGLCSEIRQNMRFNNSYEKHRSGPMCLDDDLLIKLYMDIREFIYNKLTSVEALNDSQIAEFANHAGLLLQLISTTSFPAIVGLGPLSEADQHECLLQGAFLSAHKLLHKHSFDHNTPVIMPVVFGAKTLAQMYPPARGIDDPSITALTRFKSLFL